MILTSESIVFQIRSKSVLLCLSLQHITFDMMRTLFSILAFASLIATAKLVGSCGEDTPVQTTSAELNLDSLLQKYPDSVELLVKQGNHYLDSYMYADALKLGAKAFRLDSTNIEARFLYANAINNMPNRSVVDVDNAQKHFIYVIKHQPQNKKAYISLATTYSQQGEFEKSFQYINEVLRKDKRYRDAYILKGSNYLAMGDSALAKSSYETAVQQDPNFFEGYMALAYLYASDKDPIALEYFKTAATLKPKSVDALYGIAMTYQEQGKYDEALKGYRALIQADQKFYLALYNQAYIKQCYQYQPDSAIYYYRSALEIEPEFVKGWHNLGLVYAYDKHDKTNALKCFAKALKYNPNFEMSRQEADKLK